MSREMSPMSAVMSTWSRSTEGPLVDSEEHHPSTSLEQPRAPNRAPMACDLHPPPSPGHLHANSSPVPTWQAADPGDESVALIPAPDPGSGEPLAVVAAQSILQSVSSLTGHWLAKMLATAHSSSLTWAGVRW